MTSSTRKIAALMLALSVSGLGHAQATRQLIKPADSTSITATAGPSIVMPSMPSNVCTSTNNNCVTAATLPGYVAPLIPSPNRVTGTLATGIMTYGFYALSTQGSINYICFWGMGEPNDPNTGYGLACPSGSGAIVISRFISSNAG